METERRAVDSAYESDFHEWLIAQSAAIHERRWQDVDVDHLTEELDGLAARDRREIVSRLTVLIMHLLKQDAQPDGDSRSWRSTIHTQAQRLNLLLDDSPSLRAQLSSFVAKSFPNSRALAADETEFAIETFPSEMTDALWVRLRDALAETASAPKRSR